MNYEELSDFEINKRVAFAISTADFETNGCEVVRYFCDGQHLEEPEVFDPCNNPADAWPVIFDSKINIIWTGYEWMASTLIKDGHFWSEKQKSFSPNKPLRAAMICYLMMQEAK